MKTAIIFGVTGQIGSYLLDLLLSKDYFVYGAARRVSHPNTGRISSHLNNPNFKLLCCDITDTISLLNLFNKVIHDGTEFEVYNLAAQSFVAESFNQPGLTWDVTAKGHLNLLDVIRFFQNKANFKTFFMSSSETFGSNVDSDGFQRETTPMVANSPYGVAKLAAFNLGNIYKQSYNMNIRNGIIFNSESPRRGEEFVTRKITRWFGNYVANDFTFKEKLSLGNLESYRDWTHAKDTANAIHCIMQNKVPKNYVVSSGQTHTIFSFLLKCYEFSVSLKGCCNKPHILEELYFIDRNLYRPCEVPLLKGDSSNIRNDLKWSPKISFDELVEDMMISDIFLASRDKNVKTKIKV